MNALQSLSTGNEEEAFNVTALLRSTHEVETRVQEIYRCFSLLSTFAAHQLGIASEVLQGNSITRNECHNVQAAFQQHLSDYGGALHAINPCTSILHMPDTGFCTGGGSCGSRMSERAGRSLAATG